MGILVLAVVRAVVVAELIILSISPLTSLILGIRVVLVTKFVISGILSLIFLILASYSIFLTKAFITNLFNLPKSAKVDYNFPISDLSTLLFKLLKQLGTLFN